MASLAQARWVAGHQNLVVTAPTGVGKSFLACALANPALRAGHTGTYVRVPRLIDDLAVAGPMAATAGSWLASAGFRCWSLMISY